MIRSFIYIVKVGLLVAAAVWLADRPGTVRLDWMDYTVHARTGFVLIALVGVILLAILIYSFLRFIVELPRRYRRHREITNREKGHRALAIGLTAVAAGDVKIASKQAKRAVKFLPHDKGMPLLLQAQAERLKGNEAEAQRIFEAMLDNKDTAFLGVRGLLNNALETKNYPKALELAERGQKLYPKQKWILRILYDLQIRSRHWDDARRILTQAEHAGAVTPEEARSDRVAMLMVEAEDLQSRGMLEEGLKKLKQAYRLDPYFIPGVLALARRYKYDGKKKKAVNLLEKAWSKNPHAALAKAWPEFIISTKTIDAFARVKWAERLLRDHPESPEAHLVIADLTMDAMLWGEARSHIHKAEDVTKDARVYKKYAEVERRAFQDDSGAIMWLKKAEDAPQPRAWVCRESGKIYSEWHPIAEPHGAFNTIIWDFPASYVVMTLPPPPIVGDPALLEIPQIFRA